MLIFSPKFDLFASRHIYPKHWATIFPGQNVREQPENKQTSFYGIVY